MTSSDGTISMLLALCEGKPPVGVPHKGQWHEALMFSLICAWTNGYANNRDAGDLRHHCAYYYVTVMNVSHRGNGQRKHHSSASLAFVRGIHWGPVNSPHKWPVTRKMFPSDDVIMGISIQSATNTGRLNLEVKWCRPIRLPCAILQ